MDLFASSMKGKQQSKALRPLTSVCDSVTWVIPPNVFNLLIVAFSTT